MDVTLWKQISKIIRDEIYPDSKLTEWKLQDVTNVDRLVVKRDQSIEFHRSFFYRNGYSAETMAKGLMRDIQQALNLTKGCQDVQPFLVEAREHWNQWPRESYWSVTITLKTMIEDATGVFIEDTKR